MENSPFLYITSPLMYIYTHKTFNRFICYEQMWAPQCWHALNIILHPLECMNANSPMHVLEITH